MSFNSNLTRVLSFNSNSTRVFSFNSKSYSSFEFYSKIRTQLDSKFRVQNSHWLKVITCIIGIIHNTWMIQIFEYFELNNNYIQVMQGGFKSNTTALRVMQVLESRRGEPCLMSSHYASICEYSNISNLFLIFDHA